MSFLNFLKPVLLGLIVSVFNSYAFCQIDSVTINSSLGEKQIEHKIYFDKGVWHFDKTLKNQQWIYESDSCEATVNITFREKELKILNKKLDSKISDEDYLKLHLDRIYEENKSTEKPGLLNKEIETKSRVIFDVTQKTLWVEGVDITNNHCLISVFIMNKFGSVSQLLFSGKYNNGKMIDLVNEFISRNS